MSVRLRSVLVALPVAALLAVPGGALAAKTRTTVEPTRANGFVKLRGTHGWRFQIVGAASGSRRDGHAVAVYASGPDHQEVDYQHFPGHFNKDGTLDAKLPGVGRIDLRFEATSHSPVSISGGGECTVSTHTSIVSSGAFRGTVELHPEGGFTSVSAHSARGEIWTYPKQTCRERIPSKAEIESQTAGQGKEPPLQTLFAWRKLGTGRLDFQATSIAGLLPGSSRHLEFAAEYGRRRDGMWITAIAQTEADLEDFTLSAPTRTVSEATVEPPAPFLGSAEFTLESPTVAGWTGDLRVSLATLGTVDLTGPRFESTFCEDSECTDTAPGLRFGFLVGFDE